MTVTFYEVSGVGAYFPEGFTMNVTSDVLLCLLCAGLTPTVTFRQTTCGFPPIRIQGTLSRNELHIVGVPMITFCTLPEKRVSHKTMGYKTQAIWLAAHLSHATHTAQHTFSPNKILLQQGYMCGQIMMQQTQFMTCTGPTV